MAIKKESFYKKYKATKEEQEIVINPITTKLISYIGVVFKTILFLLLLTLIIVGVFTLFDNTMRETLLNTVAGYFN